MIVLDRLEPTLGGLKLSEILWQREDQTERVKHGFHLDDRRSICGRGERTGLPLTADPYLGLNCPHCIWALVARSTRSELLGIPMEYLEARVFPRYARAIRKMVPDGATLADFLRASSEERLLATPEIGQEGLKAIHSVLKELGLRLRARPRLEIPKLERTPVRRKGRPAAPKEPRRPSAAERLLALDAEEIRTSTLQGLGERIGVSRQRVLQILQENPDIAKLRGAEARCS